MISGAPMWSIMALAMTLPTAIPAAQHVAVNSLRHRQWTAVGEYLAVYLGLWLLFGLLAIATLALLPTTSRDLMFAGGLALAAAWELTPLKRLALNRCHRGSPLRPRGLRATTTVLRFAWINGSACVGSCWVAMVVMLLASSAQIEWALGLTALMVYTKLTRTPRRAVLRTATALALAAAVVTAGLLVG
jgi:predicted metal-binding membrane protein